MRVTNIGHATLAIECGFSIMTDPWLTPRLDRFWEHFPQHERPLAIPDPDVVLLSHHHYDHFHLPSLATLSRDTIVLFPASRATRAATAPGGGAFAIPWLLRRLGFSRIKGLAPFERLPLGPIEITCLPSAVDFPELGFLISDGQSHIFLAGDSMLHPGTRGWFESNAITPAVSVLPVHSTANNACFRDREELEDLGSKRAEATATFRDYLQLFRNGKVISGAFGWRVATPVDAGEPKCDWMNGRIFPLTVADGFDIALEMGSDVHLWAPGDAFSVNASGAVRGEGKHWDDIDFYRLTCREYRNENVPSPMPAFDPAKIGSPLSALERQDIAGFVEQSIPDLIRSTPYYMQAIERGLRTRLRITGSVDKCWIADFGTGECVISSSDSNDFDH